MFPSSNNANNEREGILMQIVNQADSVRKTFESVQPRITVSSATAAAAAELASKNKKRKTEEEDVSGTASPRKQAATSTHFFHSGIAHLTNKRVISNESTTCVNQKFASPKDTSLKDQAQSIQITQNDVVFGDDKFMDETNLVGNRRFRVWIDLHSKSFSKAPRAEDQVKIARSIVGTIQSCCAPHGRFFSMDCNSGELYEVGIEKAVEMTMGALKRETMHHPGICAEPVPSCGESKCNTYASKAA